MNKIKKYAITGVVALVILVATFMAGRYSSPTKTIEKTVTQTVVQTQIQYKDRIVDHVVYVKVKNTKRDTHTVTTTIKKPNGEVVTTTVVDNHVNTHTDVNQNTVVSNTVTKDTNQKVDTKTQTEKITEKGLPNWNVGVLAGLDLRTADFTKPVGSLPFMIGVEADRRIFGTFGLGLWSIWEFNGSNSFVPAVGVKANLGF